MPSRANHGCNAGDILFIAFATTPKNSPLVIRYGRHSRRIWWAGWVPTPLPSKGTVLQTAEFADSLYLPRYEGAFIYTGLPLPLSPGPVRLGRSNRKLLFVCLQLRCFASASLKNRISPLFCGATAVIVDFSYCGLFKPVFQSTLSFTFGSLCFKWAPSLPRRTSMVEPMGLEPTTFSLQGNCAPNCATAPQCPQPLFNDHLQGRTGQVRKIQVENIPKIATA